MYDVTDVLPGTGVSAFEPGTSLLVTGTRADTGELALDLLAGGDEPAVVITTNESADRTVAAFERRGALGPDRLGIVDCTSGETDGDDRDDDIPVESLGSPGDLTGISLEFAKIARELQADDGRLRVGLATISTVLMYAETETTFRFLHVFTSRIRSADWLGVFTLDPEMHEPRTSNTIRAVFDCEARVSGGEVEIRGDGFQ